MKHFLITYRLTSGSEEQRRQEIATFISAVENDSSLRGKIGYRCMKAREGSDYYHLATATDDEAVKALQSRDFFSRYTDQTDAAAGGNVEVLPLEMIAETS
ncbi:MAG: hypothetical protein ABI186_07120 [Candidatus Elarobacter sp.]